MHIFLDDQLLNEIDLKQSINKPDGKKPFLKPHYLLLSLALDGEHRCNLYKTKLLSQYCIDYVRLYKK